MQEPDTATANESDVRGRADVLARSSFVPDGQLPTVASCQETVQSVKNGSKYHHIQQNWSSPTNVPLRKKGSEDTTCTQGMGPLFNATFLS